MIAGAVDQDGGMSAQRDGVTEFREHHVHGLCRGACQDNGDASIPIGADGAEQVSRLDAVIADGARGLPRGAQRWVKVPF